MSDNPCLDKLATADFNKQECYKDYNVCSHISGSYFRNGICQRKEFAGQYGNSVVDSRAHAEISSNLIRVRFNHQSGAWIDLNNMSYQSTLIMNFAEYTYSNGCLRACNVSCGACVDIFQVNNNMQESNHNGVHFQYLNGHFRVAFHPYVGAWVQIMKLSDYPLKCPDGFLPYGNSSFTKSCFFKFPF